MIYQGMRKRLRGGTGKEGTCNSDRKICCVVYAEGQIDADLMFRVAPSSFEYSMSARKSHLNIREISYTSSPLVAELNLPLVLA